MASGGGIETPWGAIIGAISNAVQSISDINAQQYQAETAKFFKEGTIIKKEDRDKILFFAMIILLVVVLFLFRKK